MIIHVVKSGETLWQIANRYRVPMDSIVAANGLSDPDVLVVGEALLVPTEDIFYVVKPGDTLWNIAQEYGVTMPYILKNNAIANPNSIYPGMMIYIPAARHRVAAGESLWGIARRYGVSLQDLIRINDIEDPDRIQPGMELIIPRTVRPVKTVNGYIYMLGQAAVPIVREVGRLLTYLSPFAYLIREDASLQPIEDEPAIQTGREEGAVPMMAVTNFTATSKGENLASIILNDAALSAQLLTNSMNIMRQKGYKGLNVDFENVLPEDRGAYNRFLEGAAARLHASGYFLSTALAPKTGPEQAGLLYEAHDYPAHGRIADFVILMTYEWGYRKGPPQAISPIDRIREVLDYAVSVIPRNKILMGFQIYARDWTLPHTQGDEAETFSPQEAIRRAAQFGAEIQYDYTAESPYFRYTDSRGSAHEVWFEDARSARAKFSAVKDYNLAGVSYWALGYPFPQNWVLLEDTFRIRR
ncbi:LysM peptidoglycan-binding domain-containing protein [Papillibacter cinnamivorans]|uniref:Spore germination protein n=1 Tax=Papillibacter cinnamivorans DSM 12816 TaxID=1122930 RepID=A0A1W2CNP0_9FIRM|nr:LysM peptidoglycan-binding domain-containing protein [Papillibacter cinnamivorans]SMC86857.1 spore germination protein [Papillibacter cinnamivorans DSM 12816]